LLDTADRTVCVSKTILQRYLELGGTSERARVIYSGIRPAPWKRESHQTRKELNLPDGVPIVTFAGRVDSNKRPHLFLKAAEQVHALLPQAQFVLAGTSFPCHADYSEWFAAELSRSTVKENFHLAGFRFDIGTLFANSSAFVFTSRREGFPRAVVEAMLQGVPVIATRCAAIEEYMRDGFNGYLVGGNTEEEEINGLAARMLLVLNQGVPTDLRQNAIQAASAFTIQSHVRQIEGLYAELISKSGDTRCALA
jgi:glycosyltransferase involved in cell wall biosynthesis